MNYATMIEQEYSMAMAQPSDINEHIQMLYGLGKHCKHVTEMGVRDGKSSRAFLKAGVTLRSYDIEKNMAYAAVFIRRGNMGIGFEPQSINTGFDSRQSISHSKRPRPFIM